jgi:hypothetical protein
MGAKDSQMKPYLKYYHSRGFDTLSFAVGPMHVLFPDKAKSQMNTVLTQALEHSAEESDAENPAKSNDIVFHSFSMGGYLFGHSLMLIRDNPEKFGNLPGLIKAQIFDSPPDMGSIPYGLAKSVGFGVPVEKVVEKVVQLYLTLTASTSGVAYKASSDIFHNNYLSAPALWFYSRADPISRFQDCETVVSKWKARGTEVQTCTWDDSPHIQHGRLYPDRYFSTLGSFLEKCDVVSPLDGGKYSEKVQVVEEDKVRANPSRKGSAPVMA